MTELNIDLKINPPTTIDIEMEKKKLKKYFQIQIIASIVATVLTVILPPLYRNIVADPLINPMFLFILIPASLIFAFKDTTAKIDLLNSLDIISVERHPDANSELASFIDDGVVAEYLRKVYLQGRELTIYEFKVIKQWYQSSDERQQSLHRLDALKQQVGK